MISRSLGIALDSIPLRFAAALAILALLPYNKYVAIGVFLIVAGVYIQHHLDSVKGIMMSQPNVPRELQFPMPAPISDAPDHLQKGGHTDVEYDNMDFMPKDENQDNQFGAAPESLDEKHALATEPLGSKAQALFIEDQAHAEYLMRESRNAAFSA